MSLLAQQKIPGLTLAEGKSWEVDYEHQEVEEDNIYFQKAFPRLRQMRLAEFMQVRLPYVLVAACVLGRAVAEYWGQIVGLAAKLGAAP